MKPFVPTTAPHNFLPDRPVSVKHLRMDVRLDFESRSIEGSVALDVFARAQEVRTIHLNAVDMTILSVTVNGKPVRDTHYDNRILSVPLPKFASRGDNFSLVVAYRAQPEKGLYFLGPDATDPERPTQAWTQGQDEDARYFVPCIDIPIEKATSETLCDAPADMTVVCNGDLLLCEESAAGRRKWHYKLALPSSSYLLTLACGVFTEVRDQAPKTGTNVYHFVPPGKAEQCQTSLGRTGAMIDYFSELIGIPYPHKRYSHVVVSDFVFGGMENTSATTLTDDVMLDERAALDRDMEDLVAHELAHQWWGDLVTCREWSHAWLNEGFATYFEYLWYEHSQDRDTADVHLLANLDRYLGESNHYQRPIVCRHYREPIELFDAHLYEKGGRVLHMLRHRFGDDDFFAALRLYGQRHAGGSVETRDLVRAFEEVTGRDCERFFDQWVYQPGHPVITARWSWDEKASTGTLGLEIKRSGDDDGASEGTRQNMQFELPVAITTDGATRELRFDVKSESHCFEIPLSHRPQRVVVDPGGIILAKIELEFDLALLKNQLQHAPRAVDRIRAARTMGTRHEQMSVRALDTAMRADPHWAVRGEAALALGALGRPDALTALAKAPRDKSAKTRKMVATALGSFRDQPEAASILAPWLDEGDGSYGVEASLALALGKSGDLRAIGLLPRVMRRPSHLDTIRSHCLAGLGYSNAADALPIVFAALTPQIPYRSRIAAIGAIARLAEGGTEARAARERLQALLRDRHFMVRAAAAEGLVVLADDRALPFMQRALAAEKDGRTRRTIAECIENLREGRSASDETKKLRNQVTEMRADLHKLRQGVEILQARTTPSTPPTTPPAKPTGRRPRPATRRAGKTTRSPRRPR